MISNFELKGFKGHGTETDIELNGLTIVAGTNNSGKSSMLQGLYLSTQNRAGVATTLSFQETLKLGGFKDVLYWENDPEDTIDFLITFDSEMTSKKGIDMLRVKLSYQSELRFPFIRHEPKSTDNAVLSEMLLSYYDNNGSFHEITLTLSFHEGESWYLVKGEDDYGYCKLKGLDPDPVLYRDLENRERVFLSREFETLLPFLALLKQDAIQYLTAERLDLSDEESAGDLERNMNKAVNFLKGDGTAYLFEELLDEWVSRLIGPNYKIRPVRVDGQPRVKVSEETDSGIHQLFLNQVGFGFSQLLPLLTRICSSKKGDILMIENPEVHLHPKLQSLFVDLCVFGVEHGRKFVIETHSEHIVNRTRLLIKKNKGSIDFDLLSKVKVYFFEKVEGYIQADPVYLTADGKLEEWPQNFFDQTYKDMLGLMD